MADLPPSLAAALPAETRPREQAQLFGKLISLPHEGSWYSDPHDDPDPWQGDAWAGLDYVDIEALEWRKLRAVVITNSCDVSSENARVVSLGIVLCPLVRASRYESLLGSVGASEAYIRDHLAAARRQEISNIFFFPRGAGLDDDYLVRFDDVQSQLPNRFRANEAKQRMFSLSQEAFWLFLVKLSTHFCRAGEGIPRLTT